MDLKNRMVNFRICDIYYPDYQQVLFELHGNEVLQGRVIAESGPEKVPVSEARDVVLHFAEIELDDLRERVIVPVDRILGIQEVENQSE